MIKAFFYLVYVPFHVIKFIIEVIEKILFPVFKYVINTFLAPINKQVNTFFDKMELKYKEPLTLTFIIFLFICVYIYNRLINGIHSEVLYYIIALVICFVTLHILYRKFNIAKMIIWLSITLIIGFFMFFIVGFFVNMFIQNSIINLFIFIISTIVVGFKRRKYLISLTNQSAEL